MSCQYIYTYIYIYIYICLCICDKHALTLPMSFKISGKLFVYNGQELQLELILSQHTGNSVLMCVNGSYSLSTNINKQLPPNHVFVECFNNTSLTKNLVEQKFAHYKYTIQHGHNSFDVLQILQ